MIIPDLNPLKDVDSRVFTRMLRKDGRTDGSVTIFLRNFVGDGITKQSQKEEKS
jgi:carbamoylphosphate synthase small subunit